MCVRESARAFTHHSTKWTVPKSSETVLGKFISIPKCCRLNGCVLMPSMLDMSRTTHSCDVNDDVENYQAIARKKLTWIQRFQRKPERKLTFFRRQREKIIAKQISTWKSTTANNVQMTTEKPERTKPKWKLWMKWYNTKRQENERLKVKIEIGCVREREMKSNIMRNVKMNSQSQCQKATFGKRNERLRWKRKNVLSNEQR